MAEYILNPTQRRREKKVTKQLHTNFILRNILYLARASVEIYKWDH